MSRKKINDDEHTIHYKIMSLKDGERYETDGEWIARLVDNIQDNLDRIENKFEEFENDFISYQNKRLAQTDKLISTVNLWGTIFILAIVAVSIK